MQADRTGPIPFLCEWKPATTRQWTSRKFNNFEFAKSSELKEAVPVNTGTAVLKCRPHDLREEILSLHEIASFLETRSRDAVFAGGDASESYQLAGTMSGPGRGKLLRCRDEELLGVQGTIFTGREAAEHRDQVFDALWLLFNRPVRESSRASLILLADRPVEFLEDRIGRDFLHLLAVLSPWIRIPLQETAAPFDSVAGNLVAGKDQA